jgi:hypothetical protein
MDESEALRDLGYAEQRDDRKREVVFSEFNTLAIIFNTPAALFIDEKYRLVRYITLS